MSFLTMIVIFLSVVSYRFVVPPGTHILSRDAGYLHPETSNTQQSLCSPCWYVLIDGRCYGTEMD